MSDLEKNEEVVEEINEEATVETEEEVEEIAPEEQPADSNTEVPPMDFSQMGGLGGMFGALAGMMAGAQPPIPEAVKEESKEESQDIPEEAIKIDESKTVLVKIEELDKLNSEFLNYTLLKYNINDKYEVVRIPDEAMSTRLYVKDCSKIEPVLYPFDTTAVSVKGFAGLTIVYSIFDIIYLDGLKAMVTGFDIRDDYLCLECISKIGNVSIPVSFDNNIIILDSNADIRNKVLNKL